MTIYAKSATKEGLLPLVKDFYCGSDISFKLHNGYLYHVYNAKGKIEGVAVEKIRGNWCFGNATQYTDVKA